MQVVEFDPVIMIHLLRKGMLVLFCDGKFNKTYGRSLLGNNCVEHFLDQNIGSNVYKIKRADFNGNFYRNGATI